MTRPEVKLPIPVPMTEIPPPPIPKHMIQRPSPLALSTVLMSGYLELAIVYKRTFSIRPAGSVVAVETQAPLAREDVAHAELAPGVPTSMKHVPEACGFRQGTDVIVRAHARAPRAVEQMRVSVRIGDRTHAADILGNRRVAISGGRVVFSKPEPFEVMPLRYELAYGGRDTLLLERTLAQLQEGLGTENWRRGAAFLKDAADFMPPIAYPRNRYGRGYAVLGVSRDVEGMVLPNIELPNDRLTPERLLVGDHRLWYRQPVPAGFDFMDATMFPRTAMMGLPPTQFDFDSVAEVASGQVPRGYVRGYVLSTAPEKIGDLIHPEVSRCAPIGLRFPVLRGDEAIVLSGMAHECTERTVCLPAEYPVFATPLERGDIDGRLGQVFVDADQQRLELIWTARTPIARAPRLDSIPEIESQVRVTLVRGTARI